MGSDLEHVANPPAAVEKRPTPPKPKTDDWALVIGPVSQLAETVANTEFVPTALRGKPAAVTAAVLFGRELEMPPMQALAQIHVIEGRPSLSSEHMRAMVLAAGHSLRVTGDGGQATATGRRLLWRNPQTGEPQYDEPVSVTWTLAQARAAGLINEKKKNWLRHPRQMLKARATAELCRDLFPDVCHGLSALEEAEDDDAVLPAAADVPTEKVSRAKRGVSSKPAAAAGGAETPAAPATPTAPDTVSIPEVPLPGEEEPAESTPGEGLGSPGDSPAAGTTSTRQCPHISNGIQCRLYAGHLDRGSDHSFGGGMGDPVGAKRCKIGPEHKAHAWNEQGGDWYSCSGRGTWAPDGVLDSAVLDEPPAAPDDYPDAEVVSEGDGSPDDVAATATDETWAAAQEAAGGPVEDNDPPISPGAMKALAAAFTSLGVRDDMERRHTTSALLGRRIESWKELTRGDGQKLFKVVENLANREELEVMVQRAVAEHEATP